jgi:glycine/D-amino acid oxidase-like deaminating enzyme
MSIAHLLIDQPTLSQSSRIAAGLVNPVVLKRLKAVHDAQQFIEEALPFYEDIEKQANSQFLHSIPVQHILQSQEEQNNWHTRSMHPSLSPFLNPTLKKETLKHIPAPYGLGEVWQSFWVNTPHFLAAHKEVLAKHILAFGINSENIDLERKTLTLNDRQYSFDYLVDCSGHLARALHPELEQVFTPTRGEVLIIKAPSLDESKLLHAGIFILPLGNQLFKVGATYHWDTLEDKPTPEGREKLITELEKIYSGQYEVIEHLAGVRPNIKDRKPLLGQLKKGLYMFNGMGSRAVLMAPYLADLLINHVEQKTPLPKEYDLNRFSIF